MSRVCRQVLHVGNYSVYESISMQLQKIVSPLHIIYACRRIFKTKSVINKFWQTYVLTIRALLTNAS